MQQAITHGVGDGGFADDVVPVLGRTLAGDHGATLVMAVLDDFEQVVALGIFKRSQEQIVGDKQLNFSQTVESFEVGAIGFGLERGFKQARSAQIKHGMALTCCEVAKALDLH